LLSTPCLAPQIRPWPRSAFNATDRLQPCYIVIDRLQPCCHAIDRLQPCPRALGPAPSLPSLRAHQVEATKYTEVGYHGRDVDSIIKDLVDASITLVRQRLRKAHEEELKKVRMMAC
jgi:hypothetical protein